MSEIFDKAKKRAAEIQEKQDEEEVRKNRESQVKVNREQNAANLVRRIQEKIENFIAQISGALELEEIAKKGYEFKIEIAGNIIKPPKDWNTILKNQEYLEPPYKGDKKWFPYAFHETKPSDEGYGGYYSELMENIVITIEKGTRSNKLEIGVTPKVDEEFDKIILIIKVDKDYLDELNKDYTRDPYFLWDHKYGKPPIDSRLEEKFQFTELLSGEAKQFFKMGMVEVLALIESKS